MRTAPALQVTVSRRGAWRWLVVALAAASAAAVAAWIGSRLESSPPSMAIAVCMASVLAAVVALRAMKLPPLGLRFDGQCWHLRVAPEANETGWSGDVSVVMDLGPWMLLRFDAHTVEAQVRYRRWLAVDRGELGPQWHALRCAVYSPRPGASSASRDAPVDPSSRE